MFEKIGISTDILIIFMLLFIFILIVMVIILAAKIGNLTIIYKKYMKGANGKSLAEQFKDEFAKLGGIEENLGKADARLTELENSSEAGFTKYAVRKYDAFPDMGGKLSFSVCMLTNNDNGIIITTVHNTEGSYTYLKEVVKGESFTKLSGEEKHALNDAITYNDPVKAVINERK